MTNPFFTDTTLPDGTTRGPIVERVEECRPVWPELKSRLVWNDRREYFEWECPPTQHPDEWMGVCEKHEARALSRVAVEDWVEEHGIFSMARLGSKFQAIVSLCNFMDFLAVVGPTRDDALNLLAHHLADALGLPRRKGDNS